LSDTNLAVKKASETYVHEEGDTEEQIFEVRHFSVEDFKTADSAVYSL
jgi:hypothetical protein